jgi:putative drug exporter of the RND superfamily
MFARWGAFVYRFRRPVVIVTLALAIGSVFFASKAAGELSSGGWLDKGSESAAVITRLDASFAAGRSSFVALFHGPSSGDATSTDFQGAIATATERLRADPRVVGVVGYAETGDRRFISTDGHGAYSVVQLNLTNEQSVDAIAGLKAEIAPPAGYTVQLTGYGPIGRDQTTQSEADLQRAETVSAPLVLLILVAVFASLIAAGMPLLIAALAIPTTLGFVYFVAQRVEMSIYVLNISTMLGLALAIDYSLFIVSRFREELARGRTVGEAVEKAVATSGKAVAFSGFAVAVGLSGLLFMKAPALNSIGIGGSLVVLSSVFFALTFLPALLGILGPRINALSLRGLFVRLGIMSRTRQPGHRWERVARAVMARPVLVLAPVLIFLLAAGTPFLRVKQAVPGAEVLPAGLESRDTYVAIQQQFPRGETTPITILADVNGDPTSPGNALALARYAQALEAVNGIDRVESPFSLRDPATGAPMPPEQIAAIYAQPPDQRPAAIQSLLAGYVRGQTVRLDAVSPLDPASTAGTAVIPVVRSIVPEAGIRTAVGGSAALGYDFLAAQSDRIPWAVGMTLLASAVVLFLLFGSVVIPIKAVVMTLLSVSASFGALVWIFQEGNLSNVLGFQPLGTTIAGNPIIMFSVIFGLSMDYEVLLLSRIQEAYRRRGDNRESVAEGLARTASVITGAALIMVAVFAAFALADVITIKSIGVGMAIAVLIDATVIRVLLVPATMRLLGDWNWWAPGPLGRFAARLGFSHVEADDAAGEAADGAEGVADGVRSAGAVG